ncbi:MAG TPA: relaxase/mobilization nuclease domain-containing protein [Sphingobacterium sp.]|nr:relaxase/mobilization nuclease domain-containing protein [Sphingobacterium sp.]
MIAKILSSTSTFNGVSYNTTKIDKAKGELMAVKNFGILSDDVTLNQEEVKDYLKKHSSVNKRVKEKQFHATISCKGKEYDKHQLTDIAHKWIDKMGYGKNPYVIIYHNDTDNNHVHIVSSRIGTDGKKINNSNDRYRSVSYINEIVKEYLDEKQQTAKNDFSDYTVTSLAQFKLLYENVGYSVKENDDTLFFYKVGEEEISFSKPELTKRIAESKDDQKRIDQLKAILKKYHADFNNHLEPVYRKLSGGRQGELIGYKSDMTDFLREKFGLQVVFHFKDDKPPYGYTIIDHAKKNVFKGGSIMKLAAFLERGEQNTKEKYQSSRASRIKGFNTDSKEFVDALAKRFKIPVYQVPLSDRKISQQEKDYFRQLLSYYLKHHSLHSLNEIGMEHVRDKGKHFIIDQGSKTIMRAEDVLSKERMQDLDRDREHELEQESVQSQDNAVASEVISGIAGLLSGSSAAKSEDPKKKKKRKR